jgi:protoporphyrinogen oxidase
VVCGSGTHRFDRVVWTANLDGLRRALASPSEELVGRLTAVQSVAVTQLILLLRRRQTEFYWLNNLDPGNTFGGIIEHTNLVPAEHYGGRHVLYVVNYHRPGDPRFAGRSTRALLEHHLPSLSCSLPDFRREDVLRTFSIRDAHASPLYDLGFAARMPPYQGWLPNVDICGMAQVYPYDRNMNHCVENALRYVDEAYGDPVGESQAERNSFPA